MPSDAGLMFFPFLQLMLGMPDQALSILHMAIEPILAHGSVLDKGAALFLMAKCQVASAAAYVPQKKAEGRVADPSHWETLFFLSCTSPLSPWWAWLCTSRWCFSGQW